MKKRLMIVIWNMGIGGIQKRMRDMAIDISDNHKDWEIYFLIRRKVASSFLTPLEGNKDVHILYYPFQTGVRFPLGFVLWTAIQYVRLRPQVVLTFLAQLTIMMALIRKFIFWQKTMLIINEGAYVSGYLKYNSLELLRGILRLAYRSADRIIVPTNACKNDLAHSFSVPERKVEVIPNWTLLSPSQKQNSIYDCIFIGRFEYEKNPLVVVDVIKKIAKKYPSIRCAIVGDGSLKKQLEERIVKSSLEAQVNLLSTSANVQVLLDRSQILLLPSFNEGMPNIVLEAAMSRVPAVVNNFQGAHEVIINGKTGYIADSPSDMAAKIQLLLNRHDLLVEMGRQAQLYTLKNFHRVRQKEFIDVLLRRN